MEGVVIVGSILLAFGIDAWWDGVRELVSSTCPPSDVERGLIPECARVRFTSPARAPDGRRVCFSHLHLT